MSVHTAIGGPLKEMQQGRLGVGCRPNADTYNCIIMVGPPHCRCTGLGPSRKPCIHAHAAVLCTALTRLFCLS